MEVTSVAGFVDPASDASKVPNPIAAPFRLISLTIKSGAIHLDLVKRLRFDRWVYLVCLMKNRRRDPSISIPLELREFLCFAIYSANHAFNRVYQPLLVDLGLTYPQFIALVLLWGEDNQTVGELGQQLFLQSNTLTPMLKRLETLGYIKRRRDSADERQVRINLTEDGRRLHLRASDIVRRVRHATGLQNKQSEQLLEEISTLRKALESHISP